MKTPDWIKKYENMSPCPEIGFVKRNLFIMIEDHKQYHQITSEEYDSLIRLIKSESMDDLMVADGLMEQFSKRSGWIIKDAKYYFV